MMNVYFKIYKAMLKQKECATKLLTVFDKKEKQKINKELKAAQFELGGGIHIYRNILEKMKEQNLTIDDINEQWINKTFKDIWMDI